MVFGTSKTKRPYSGKNTEPQPVAESKGTVSKEVFRMGFERGIGTIYHGK